MQDRFVGDIGDFGKYGLLRAICGIAPRAEPKRSLGVVWYVPDDATVEKTSDGHGQDVGYLFDSRMRSKLRRCDCVLYDRLKEIVSENRCLAAVDQRKILGSEADREVSFYSAQLPRDRQERERWVGDAVETVRGKDIIFCDPDTGLVPKSKRGNSPQHVLASEIESFLETARSSTVVVYQYLYPGTRKSQIDNWRRLKASIDGCDMTVVGFTQRGADNFKHALVVARRAADSVIEQRLDDLVETSPRRNHFKREVL